MAKTESFDISTGVDLQEVDNAVNQAKQEILHRFDFKGVLADVNLDRQGQKLTIHTADDFKLESIWQVMEQRLRARKVPLKNMQRGNAEKAAGSTVRQEIKIAQSPKDRYPGGYSPKTYIRRLLDILSVVFLVRFTKKPIRFFGMIGSVTFVFGGAVLFYVIIQRLFFGVALADRPALLVSSLLVVLGLQIFALGLLGELIIFTHARQIKEYTIEKIVN